MYRESRRYGRASSQGEGDCDVLKRYVPDRIEPLYTAILLPPSGIGRHRRTLKGALSGSPCARPLC